MSSRFVIRFLIWSGVVLMAAGVSVIFIFIGGETNCSSESTTALAVCQHHDLAMRGGFAVLASGAVLIFSGAVAAVRSDARARMESATIS